jgi:3-oxoacyl-[acyl-carrier protein] reductase
MELGLKDRVAAVIGGSRGLGYAIASALASEGCKLAICARAAGGLEAARQRLEALGADVLAQQGDVAAAGEAEAFVEATGRHFGRVDVLVHNAGGAAGAGALDTTDQQYVDAIGLNALVGLRAARACVPWMRQAGQGRIIFIASVYGRESGGRPAYNVGKAAEISLAKALARELAPDRILVNAIAPGSLMFPGSSWERRQQQDPEGIANFVTSDLPLKRFGTPEEVAAVVVFLASDRASLVTGSCWTVDGGQSRSLI